MYNSTYKNINFINCSVNNGANIKGGVYINNEDNINFMNKVINTNIYNKEIRDVSKVRLNKQILGYYEDFENYRFSNNISINLAQKTFKNIYDTINDLSKKINIELNKLRYDIYYKTGYSITHYLYTFMSAKYYHDKNTQLSDNYKTRFLMILRICKYYLKLNIIYDVCLNFLSKSIDNLNNDQIWPDLFKPFIEIFNEYYNKNITYKNILYNNNTIFCYLSGYLPRYEQSQFYEKFTKINKNDNILSLYQFLMGSGKSTIIIPYLVYNNIIKRIRTIILIPDNQQIKTEMIDNIFRITTLFDTKCFLYDKNIDYNILINNKINIMLLTYTEIKDMFLKLTHKGSLQGFVVYIDEVDMFLDPCTCEYNIKREESTINKKTIDVLINYINYYHNNINNIDTLNNKIKKQMDYDNNKSNDNNIIKNYTKIVHNLEFFKKFTSKLIYNKQYGVGHANKIYNGAKISLFPIAKPYKYVNIPLIDSDFSDVFIKIYTTYYSYINYKSYTYEQIEYILFTILPEYNKNNNNINNINNIKEMIQKCIDNNKNIKNIEDMSKLKNYLLYNKDIKQLQIKNFYDKVICVNNGQLLYIISHVQSNELKILNKIDNVTNYDILIGQKSVGFTGTPWVFLPNETQIFNKNNVYLNKFNKHYESISGQNYKMFNIQYTADYMKMNIHNINIHYNNINNGLIDVGY